jgi:hypothetical protein
MSYSRSRRDAPPQRPKPKPRPATASGESVSLPRPRSDLKKDKELDTYRALRAELEAVNNELKELALQKFKSKEDRDYLGLREPPPPRPPDSSPSRVSSGSE